jgi:hypothetical protein
MDFKNKIIRNTLLVATAIALVSVQFAEVANAQPRRGYKNERVLGKDHGDGAAIIAGIFGGLMLGSILSDSNRSNNKYNRRYSRQEYRYGRQRCYDNWVTRYDRAGRQVVVNDPVCNNRKRLGRR